MEMEMEMERIRIYERLPPKLLTNEREYNS